jgi:long-chain acyl-CoA synthetase
VTDASEQSGFADLLELFEHAVSNYGPRRAFGSLRDGRWEWISYAELGQKVDQMRSALAGMGVGRGDRVAIISDNRLEWIIAAHATYQRRAIYVPMYEAQGEADWSYILADAGAKVCITATSALAARVRAAREDLLELQHIVDIEAPASAEDSFQAALQQGAARPIKARQPRPEDVATIIYTSGTTGEPKGVRLTHGGLAHQAYALSASRDYGADPCSMAFLPWAHVFGGAVELNVALSIGGAVAICRNTDDLFSEIVRVRPTMIYAVPRIWNRIYYELKRDLAAEPEMTRNLFDNGLRLRARARAGETLSFTERISLGLADRFINSRLKARLGGRLRFGFSGAAPLAVEVAHYLRSVGVNVLEGYGLTESSGSTTSNPTDAVKDGSVGRAIVGTRIVIDDTVTVTGTRGGEIVLYGSGVMEGYHNRPEETARAMTPDGGLRTGDLGYLDDDGYLYVTGRIKELYKLNSGRYVAPVPLEEKLKLSPFISQCLIYGSGQPYNVALIVVDVPSLQAYYGEMGASPQELLTDPRTRRLFEEEVLKYSRDFRTFELVRNFWLIMEPFSRENGMLTPTLKLRRVEALKRYEANLLALY